MGEEKEQLKNLLAQSEKTLQETEAMFHSFVENSSDIIFMLGEDGVFTYVSPNWRNLLGHDVSQVNGNSFHDFLHNDDLSRFSSFLESVMHTKQMQESFEYRVKHADGAWRWHAIRGFLLSKNEGNVFIGISRDITERKKAEAALKESEKKYREIISTIEDGYYEVDLEGNFVFCNDSFCRMFSCSREELLRQNYRYFYRNPGEVYKTFNRVYRTGEPEKAVDWLASTYDGKQIFIEVSISLRKDGEGNPVGFMGIARDISERKLIEQRIAEYTKKLEQLYNRLDKELDKAREIHQRILPDNLPQPESIYLAAYYHPAAEIGGDFYDCIRKNDKLVIYLSDVMGHGLDSAMLSAFVKYTMDGFLALSPEQDIAPQKALRYLADQYYREGYPDDYFICMFMVVLDLETDELSYTGAGFHTPPLACLGDGVFKKLISQGPPIASAVSPAFLDLTEETLQLTPGTTILFSTDGLLEQEVGSGRYDNRLEQIFCRLTHLSPEQIIRAINEDIQKYNQKRTAFDDDITFLVLQKGKGAGKGCPQQVQKNRGIPL